MLTEIAKLEVVRAVGLPAEVFADVAPRVVTAWRARAAVESPSHLRGHSPEVTVTLLAALLYCREREITDTLVELLISTVHRINARAEVRVTKELIKELKRVTGKENLLFRVAEDRHPVLPAALQPAQTRQIPHRAGVAFGVPRGSWSVSGPNRSPEDA
jgi:hypothetical protein